MKRTEHPAPHWFVPANRTRSDSEQNTRWSLELCRKSTVQCHHFTLRIRYTFATLCSFKPFLAFAHVDLSKCTQWARASHVDGLGPHLGLCSISPSDRPNCDPAAIVQGTFLLGAAGWRPQVNTVESGQQVPHCILYITPGTTCSMT